MDSAATTTAYSPLQCLIDGMAQPLLIVDLMGRLIHANRIAHLELATSRTLHLKCGLITATAYSEHEALCAALDKASQGKRSMVRLAHQLVIVMPLLDAGQFIALKLERVSLCEHTVLELFARHHRLSPTEERVLRELCEGLEVPDVAQALGVAISTVRSHVRSLCHKTTTRSIRQLVERIARLPALAAL